MMLRLRRFFARLFVRTPKVVVPVTADLLRLYKHIAAREGFTVEEWARRALNNAVPKNEMRKLAAGTMRAAGIDAAFDQLDRDEALMPNMLPLAPTASGNPVPIRLPVVPPVPGHPCAMLRAEYPRGYTAKDCQGSCSHPSQEGRVCHWGPPVAAQCPVFVPRFRLPQAAQQQ